MGTVREIVTLAQQARAQADIRERLYRGLPGWHRPPGFLELDRFDRQHEPFWEGHEGTTFVHEEGGKVIARITVFLPRGGSKAGRFGVFDSVDDPATARSVIDAGAAWLVARGASAMEGPTFFSMHEEVGLLVDGFELPSAIYMPYNPPHYASLLEAAGFAPVRSFGTYRYDLATCYQAVVDRGGEREGVTTRAFDRSREAEEIGALLTVYNAAFAANWGFTPLTPRQGRALVKNLLAVGDPRLVRVGELEGRPIGFILCVPDVNGYLHSIRSWPGWLVTPMLALAVLAKRIRDCRVITLAVVPELQGQGVSRVLIKSLASTARSIGYGNAELSYIDTENHWMNRLLKGYNFASRKGYRIYAKKIGS